MGLYTVHLRRHALDPDRDLVLVKEGFSWPAFLFSVLWALWHRLWLEAVIVALAEAAAGAALVGFGADEASQAAVSLALALVLGYVANDLRRSKLGRRGFVEAAVVQGRGRDEAERRFLGGVPALAAELRA